MADGMTTHASPPAWRPSSARASASLKRTLSLLGFVAMWELVSRMAWTISVPSPTVVVSAFLSLDLASLALELFKSFYRVLAGFLLAAAVGIPLGIWIGSTWAGRTLVFPTLEVLRPVPPIAWIPLAILFFVEPQSMILFLTFLGALFPITYNTLAGISGINPSYTRSARSLGATGTRMFFHVTVPAMLPMIMSGLQIAIGTAWLMVVAGEMMASKGGIGAFTWESFQTSRYPLVFVGMAIIGLSGYATSAALKFVSARLVVWRYA
jgi:NitT/TauT family transport system permease protein